MDELASNEAVFRCIFFRLYAIFLYQIFLVVDPSGFRVVCSEGFTPNFTRVRVDVS